MTLHVGAICDPGPSHVMAMAAIGRALQARGHRVTLYAVGGLERLDVAADFPLVTIAADPAAVARRRDWIAQTHHVSAAAFVAHQRERIDLVCREGPAVLAAAGLDCVLVDALDPGAASVAEHLRLPFVTINNAVPLNAEPGVTPDFLPWRHADTAWARARNRVAYGVRNVLIRPLMRALNVHRRGWGLRPWRTPDDSFSPLAQITQLVPEFDYPRRDPARLLHYVGPYRRGAEAGAAALPPDLDGRPVVYASLGTVQGSRTQIWTAIIEAARGLDVQLVIALGDCLAPGVVEHGAAAGALVLQQHAPQRTWLRRAAAAILHGGMNSAMEALEAGVPTVTLPLVGDQFGVAARTVYRGTGVALPAQRAHADSLRHLVRAVTEEASYRRHAQAIRSAILRTRGADRAAEIVEQATRSRMPVRRDDGA